MLKRPTPTQLRAATSLKNTAAWSDLEGMIDAELLEIFGVMTESRDPVALHQLQGRVQALRGFKAFVNTSQSVLDKITK
jgi:hypothetical protein